MMKILSIPVFLILASVTIQAQPATWQPSGIGGGGALFQPAISPHNSSEIYIACDMTDLFHTTNAGLNWEVTPFEQLRSLPESQVQFTSDPNILYCIQSDFGPDLRRPMKSTDGGQTWSVLSGDPTFGEAWYLFADPNNTNRLLLSGYSTLYFSSNGGTSFTPVYSASDLYIGGVFWDGSLIFVGTRVGLLVSTDNGASFAPSNNGGLPAGAGMLSFCGANQSGQLRFFCVSRVGGMWPGMQGSEYWDDQQVYRLNYGIGNSWQVVENGIPNDAFPFYVSMPHDNLNVVYMAGASPWPNHPMVYKSVDGGSNWTSVFQTNNNQNITTAWMGDSGDLNWGWAENAMGFQVSPSNPDVAVITDFGFAHITTDGGASWYQAYSNPNSNNPSGSPTPNGANYVSNGLENTSSWWLTWLDENQIFASYTDITGVRSEDGGATWSFNYQGNDYNSTYMVLQHPSGKLYAAVSSVHDLYQSTYLRDNVIDGGSGAILVSDNNGATWSVLEDFNHPVVYLALDPNDDDVLYASVVHSSAGDIYKTSNLSAGSNANWTRLTSPPRTEGHPFNIKTLDDGTLVCTYSGRRAAGFTASSGLFVSTDGGISWEDRSDPGMYYWTKDITIDPHDADQDTWYIGVFSGWGGAPNGLGGVYRTTDRGQNWTRINDLDRVESVSIHPVLPEVMYICTEYEGLWYTDNLNGGNPSFQQLNYPFQHPLRVFFNPFDENEVWVTSFGNGLRKGATLVDAVSGSKAPELNFGLYPNPATDMVTLELSLLHPTEVSIQLLDESGRLLLNKQVSATPGDNEIQVDVSSIPSGYYEVYLWSPTAKGSKTLFVK